MSIAKGNIARVLALAATGVLVAGSAARAFDSEVHREFILEIAKLEYHVQERTLKFSKRALKEIAQANEEQDYICKFNAATFDPEKHFTDDKYALSSQGLLDRKAKILAALTKRDGRGQRIPDGSTARIVLGEALHLVQDFYSHSNWLELGHRDINRSLGRQVLPDPDPGVMPCTVDPNKVDPGAGGAPSSSYYLGATGCVPLKDQRLPMFTSAGPVVTTNSLYGSLPPGKCLHGNYGSVKPACLGISKDLNRAGAAFYGVDLNPLHDDAVRVALEASLDFIDQIMEALGPDDTGKQALLDARGSLGFAIDVTGSMGNRGFSGSLSPFETARNSVMRMVNAVKNDPNSMPTDYVLVTYADPGQLSQPLMTADPNVLFAELGRVVPFGGGDCPEASNEGLFQAIDKSLNSSIVQGYTDSEAKDPQLRMAVTKLAVKKNTRFNGPEGGICVSNFVEGGPPPQDDPFVDSDRRVPGLPFRHLPANPDDIRLAEETGGQIFATTGDPDLSEVQAAQLAGDQTLLEYRKGMGNADVSVAVDSSVERLQVTALSAVKSDIVLRTPTGEIVTSGPGVKLVELSHGRIYLIDSPADGNWKLELKGENEFIVAAYGNSPLQFADFEFVRRNEDLHGGFVPILGRPVKAASTLGQATVFGEPASVAFSIVSETGGDEGSLSMTLAVDRYLGEVVVPDVPFRVAISGTTAAGDRYRRLSPKLYVPRTVALETVGPYEVAEGVPGGTAALEFRVRNVGGATATFQLSTRTLLGFATSVTPSEVTLDAGESTTVRVSTRVPAMTEFDTTDTLFLMAYAPGDEAAQNSAMTELRVVREARIPQMLVPLR